MPESDTETPTEKLREVFEAWVPSELSDTEAAKLSDIATVDNGDGYNGYKDETINGLWVGFCAGVAYMETKGGR